MLQIRILFPHFLIFSKLQTQLLAAVEIFEQNKMLHINFYRYIRSQQILQVWTLFPHFLIFDNLQIQQNSAFCQLLQFTYNVFSYFKRTEAGAFYRRLTKEHKHCFMCGIWSFICVIHGLSWGCEINKGDPDMARTRKYVPRPITANECRP